MAKPFKPKTRDGKPGRCYYGKYKERGRWVKVRLFTDKRASEMRLADLQRIAERREAGVVTAEMDHAATPMRQHVDDYLASLARGDASAGHLDIAGRMTRRLLDECGWRHVSDVDDASLNRFIDRVRAERSTGYANKFIARAKALVHWMIAQKRIGHNPFVGVRQNRKARAATVRDRRPLTPAELVALLTTLPAATGRNDQAIYAAAVRKLCYAFGSYAGLRRGELTQLLWGDLRLDEPIPFLQLRAEATKIGRADVIPVHPYLAEMLLRRGAGDAGERVAAVVPDPKTIRADLARAGIAATDPTPDGARQRRVDFHALRHTLSSLLASTGASEPARKAILRHAKTTVNDGYTHASLAETHAALCRVPSPLNPPAESFQPRGPNSGPNPVHAPASAVADWHTTRTSAGAGRLAQVAYDDAVMRFPSPTDTDAENPNKTRPGTQAD